MTSTKDKPAAAAIKDLLSHSPDGLREIVRAVMQEMLDTSRRLLILCRPGASSRRAQVVSGQIRKLRRVSSRKKRARCFRRAFVQRHTVLLGPA